jgi:hypothetical protein
MKSKLLLALIISLSTSLSALAQNDKLLIDNIDKSGTRCVGTYYNYITKGFTDTTPIGFSIRAESSSTPLLQSLQSSASSVCLLALKPMLKL